VSWLLAFAGFATLIILHEFGHFVAAKAVGMRVERFSLFFGPMLFKVRRGETEYGIGPIPLGGYVKITGMNPNEEIPKDAAERAYYRQPVWKRIVVIAAGPLVNLALAFVVIAVIFLANGQLVGSTVVHSVDRGAPAGGVLMPGDRILAVDGRSGSLSALSHQIGTHHCAGPEVNGCPAAVPAHITLLRDGRRQTFTLVPRYDAKAGSPRVGFIFDARTVPTNVASSSGLSVSTMWDVTSATVSAVTRIFYDPQARKQVSGAVGAYETTRQSFQFSATEAFFILALISLSLAVINLFPFLPLDGGHIFWALAEKLRGRPIPFATMERASVVGIVLVAFIFLTGLSNDISRLQGQGFGVR
jgi:regulator of sigma E protease